MTKINPKAASAIDPDTSNVVESRNITDQLPDVNSTALVNKFFNNTVNHAFQPENSENVSGFIGRRVPYYNPTDEFYLPESSHDRRYYQLSPMSISAPNGTITNGIFYQDLLNLIRLQGGNDLNHDRLFREQYYSWAPPIDIDKFVNFQNYIWLPIFDQDGTPLNNTDQQDYIVINRNDVSQNPWATENRWYHLNDLTSQQVELAKAYRAKRPIIEFNSNIELYNYGTSRLPNVDIVDSSLTDPTVILTQPSYTLDGMELTNGMRVLFTNPNINNSFGWEQTTWEGENNGNGEWDASTGISFSPNDLTFSNQNGMAVIEGGSNLSNTFSPGQTININGSNSDCTNIVLAVSNNSMFLETPFNNVGVQNSQVTITIVPQFFLNRIFTVAGVGGSIKLIPTDAPVDGNIILVNSGTYAKNEYYWDATNQLWKLAQLKQKRNQNPLFVLYDVSGQRLDDPGAYPYSNFTGGKIFSYLENTSVSQPIDSLLDIRLSYDTYGEILFDNNLETSTYTYGSTTTNISGYYFYHDYVTVDYGNSWNLSPAESEQKLVSQFNVVISTASFTLDYVPYDEQVYLNGNIVSNYTVSGKVVTFDSIIPTNNVVEIKFKTNDAPIRSSITSYELPINLTANPFNGEITTVSKSDYLQHFLSIIQNQTGFTGVASGINNYRQLNVDLGKGTSIIQNFSSLAKVMGISSNNNLNIVSAIKFSEREYVRFKKKLINKITEFMASTSYNESMGADKWLYDAITSLNLAKSVQFPFAYNTIGNSYIPSTPSRLGLYPVFKPEIYLDNTLKKPIFLIQGHDGSVIPAFNDFRDQVILAFEQFIYDATPDSYKGQEKKIYDIRDSLSTPYYNADYSLDEFNQLLSPIILQWAAYNSLEMEKNDTYNELDPFSYNYSSQGLPGGWRGIMKKVYGTDRPNTHPWEMFGFSEEPDWWANRYGPRPYRYSNPFLWEDMRNGNIFSGPRQGIDARYARIGVPAPVDNNGLIRDPISLGLASQLLKSEQIMDWSIGDCSPAETVFRRSERWPFAMAIVSYLMNPAKFINFGWDLDNLKIINATGKNAQLIDRQTGKRPGVDLILHSESGYISTGLQTWLVDYVISNGQSNLEFTSTIRNLDVRLGYKTGGFMNSDTIKVLTDNVQTPIPQENVNVFLYQNPSVKEVMYSGVIVKKVSGGWEVSGYDVLNNFFYAQTPEVNGKKNTTTVGQATFKSYAKYTDTVVAVPYGTRFTNVQQVVDFLIGYGQWLERQGWVIENFDTTSNSADNWAKMANDFVFWSQGRWAIGASLALSPSSKNMKFVSSHGFVTNLDQLVNGVYSIIDVNGAVIEKTDSFISRDGDTVIINTATAMFGIRLVVSEIEHVIILDNSTIFGDLLYSPILNLYQPRLRLQGIRSLDWTGRISAPGYFVKSDTMVPNLEKSVQDVTKFFDIENQVDIPLTQEIARRNIGYQSRSYLDQILISPTTQFQFYQGFIRNKGTLTTLNTLLRSGISSGSDNVTFYEEWALKLGDFGNVSNGELIEFMINPDDLKAANQLIEFSFTRLMANISATDTSMLVEDSSDLPNSGYITIENEIIQYTTNSNNIISGMVRGSLNTSAVSHTQYTPLGLTDSQYDSIITMDPSDSKWILKPTEINNTLFKVRTDYSRRFNGEYLAYTDNRLAGYVMQSEMFARYKTIDDFINGLSSQLQQSAIEVNDQIWIDQLPSTDTTFPSQFQVYTIILHDAVIQDVIEFGSQSLLQLSNNTYAVGDSIIFDNFFVDYVNVSGIYQVIESTGNNIRINLNITSTSVYNLDSVGILDLQESHYPMATDFNPSQYPLLTFNLSNDVGLDDQSINLVSTLNLKAPGLLQIDNEIISYTTINNTTLQGIGRGVNGTSIASHLSGATATRLKDLFVYIDTRSSLTDTRPTWEVRQNTNGTWPAIRTQNYKIDTQLFKDAVLYDNLVDDVITRIQAYDPAKNIFPSQVAADITYRLDVDPANYSDDMWTSNYIGQVWWDTSNLMYENYEVTSNFYRSNNWGKLSPFSSIDIYEWVESNVLPTDWTSNSSASDYLSGTNGDPYLSSNGTIPYVQGTKTDSNGNQVTVYYFWVKNLSFMPSMPNRNYPVLSIANTMADPTSQGVLWFSPSSPNGLIVSNINNLALSDNTSIQISYNNVLSINDPHTQWLLMREGDDTSLPSNGFWSQMADSLSGYNTTLQSLPDESVEPIKWYGNSRRPRQTWFMNRDVAVKEFFKSINRLLALDQSVDRVGFTLLQAEADPATPYGTSLAQIRPINPCEFSDPLNYSTADTGSASSFVVSTFVERDALVSSGKALIGQQIMVQAGADTGGFWRIYKVINTQGTDTSTWFVETCAESFKYTDFWSYSDYTTADYNSIAAISHTAILYSELVLSDINEGEFAEVTDFSGDGSNNKAIYKMVSGTLELVFRQNGIFQFNTTLFADTTYGNNNKKKVSTAFPSGVPGRMIAVESIVNILKNNILSNLEINLIFFKMINYVFSEQLNVDWAFKTTYIIGEGLNQTTNQSPVFVFNRSQAFIDYIQEAKPYHTKLRDFRINQTINPDTANTIVTDFDKPVWHDPSIAAYRVLDPTNATDLAIMQTPGSDQYYWSENFNNNEGNVRSIETTIFFDRVSCQAGYGWDSAGWEDQVWDADIGDYLTAADRIVGSYQQLPFDQTDILKNKVTEQLNLEDMIPGCLFRGTILNNSTFNDLIQQPIGGWSETVSGPWSNTPWSPIASGSNVIDISEYNAIYNGNESSFKFTNNFGGDSSTTVFSLSAAPLTTDTLIVYIDTHLIDSSQYTVSGSQITFINAPALDSTVKISVFGQGSFNDAPITASSDIIVDGYLFRQPYLDSNHPEELVISALGESLAITVETRGEFYSVRIINRSYSGTSYGPFNIGQTVLVDDVVMVYLNGILQPNDGSIYLINQDRASITFRNTLNVSENDKITIFSANLGGEQIIQDFTDVAVNDTTSYQIDALVNNPYALVIVDGKYKNDFTISGNVISFGTPILAGSTTNIVIFKSPTYTKFIQDSFVYSSLGSNVYTLNNPLSSNADIIVSLNGVELIGIGEKAEYKVNNTSLIFFNSTKGKASTYQGGSLLVNGTAVLGANIDALVAAIKSIPNFTSYVDQDQLLIVNTLGQPITLAEGNGGLAQLKIHANTFNSRFVDTDNIEIFMAENDIVHYEVNTSNNELEYSIPHDILDPSQISLTLDGTVVPYSVDIVNNTVTLGSNPGEGHLLDVLIKFIEFSSFTGNVNKTYNLGYEVFNTQALIVTKNGIKLNPNNDYTVVSQVLTIPNSLPADDIMVYSFSARNSNSSGSFIVHYDQESNKISQNYKASQVYTLGNNISSSDTTLLINGLTDFNFGTLTLN